MERCCASSAFCTCGSAKIVATTGRGTVLLKLPAGEYYQRFGKAFVRLAALPINGCLAVSWQAVVCPETATEGPFGRGRTPQQHFHALRGMVPRVRSTALSLILGQVILVTHSEVILDEALDHNLTLLLAGRADDVAGKTAIKNSLRHYGAEHYVRARERGYVLYVEGGTDVEILTGRIGHSAAATGMSGSIHSTSRTTFRTPAWTRSWPA